MSDTKKSREELKAKLHAKIKQKQANRMSNAQRQQEVDNITKKLGISEDEMKAFGELTKMLKKNNSSFSI